jgi:sporulation protein YlmC with PRC-barrel domain
MGEPLKNPQGQTLGTIYDVVLTPDLDQISYLALSRGGLFGIGRNLYAIPWSRVELGAGGSYILPVSEQEFTHWRGFRPSAWPSDPAREWVAEGAGTSEQMTMRSQTSDQSRSAQLRRVSRIKGFPVKTPEERNAGRIQDLVVNIGSGRVLYTIVAFGGFLGIGEQYAAVPQGAIDVQPDQRVARVDVGRDVLRDNAFAAGQFPNLADPAYARDLSQAYGTGAEPDWIVLGFVPAEEPTRQPAAPDTTRRAPGTRGAITIDPGTPYNSDAARTIQGVVTSVEKTPRAGTGPESLLLHVRSDTGETYFVHAGPLDYVSKQDFFVVNGDRVRVTGAPARAEDGSVILAARISKDGQELQIRNREGKPLWEDSSKSHGEHRSDVDSHPSEHDD